LLDFYSVSSLKQQSTSRLTHLLYTMALQQIDSLTYYIPWLYSRLTHLLYTMALQQIDSLTHYIPWLYSRLTHSLYTMALQSICCKAMVYSE
jgi:hypothetical protein